MTGTTSHGSNSFYIYWRNENLKGSETGEGNLFYRLSLLSGDKQVTG
jgi:hypothetical protein